MIRIRLYILQFCSLVLILSLGAWMLMRADAASRSRAESYAGALMDQAAAGIYASIGEATEIARGFAYSEAVQKIASGGSLPQRIVDYRSAKAAHQFVTTTNRIALDMALKLNDGRSYMFGPLLTYLLRREVFIKVGEGELDDRRGAFVFFEEKDLQGSTRRLAYVLPVYSTASGEVSGRHIGTLLLLCDLKPFFEVMDAARTQEASLSLLDADGTLLWGDDPAQAHPSSHTLRTAIEPAGWQLRVDYYGDQTEQQNRDYRLFAYAAMIGVAVVIFSLSALIHHDITGPARAMQRQLNDIATDPGDQRLAITVKNELGAIAGHINHMLDRVQAVNRQNIEGQRRLLQSELEVNRLQLKALQSQINPHFLYNTLAGMRAMAQAQGAQGLANMAASMAALFRYSIKGDPYVPVEEELDITRKYLDIMNQRMDGKFSVEVDIPDTLLNSYMVKMMLQPVVENAIYHGLESKRGQGELVIRGGFVDERSYTLRVIDNGVGMAPNDVDALNRRLKGMEDDDDARENRSIGLANINRKIKLLLGPEYGVRVESELRRGTAVILYLPYLSALPSKPF